MALEGVIITGVYGTGKTSVCEELAELLESAGSAYCAIDLDWLWWFDAPGIDAATADQVGLANLSRVVENYVSVGVERYVLAGAIRSAFELAAVKAALPFPLRAVRLTVPLETIEARLSMAVTGGREKDAREAARWLAEGIGARSATW